MRLRSLDGLRGLAALCVLVMHWHQTFPSWTKPIPSAFEAAFWRNPLLLLLHHVGHVLALGGSAVIVFFVLSGFVLAISLEAPDETYSHFVVKRIFRIYPPLAFAIILSSALFLLIQPHSIPQLTDWFNKGSWTDRPNPALVGGHLAMLGTSNYESLDNAIWSLVHEMRISLVFPLIAYFVARNAKLSILFSLIVSGAALFAAHHLGSFAADWALTAHYAVLFFWGAAIAQNRVRLAQWLNARSPCAKLLLWVIVFACLFMPPEFLNGWMVYVVAVGAAGIVALCPLDSRAVNVLEAKFPLYLGKISYSLYLVHLPILLAVTHLFYDRVPTWVLVTVGTLLIFIVADLTNRWVERPSQAFGRFLVGRRHSIRYSRNCN